MNINLNELFMNIDIYRQKIVNDKNEVGEKGVEA